MEKRDQGYAAVRGGLGRSRSTGLAREKTRPLLTPIKRVWRRMGVIEGGRRALYARAKGPSFPPQQPRTSALARLLQRYSDSRVMATGMVMTERMVDRLTSRAPKGASVL